MTLEFGDPDEPLTGDNVMRVTVRVVVITRQGMPVTTALEVDREDVPDGVGEGPHYLVSIAETSDGRITRYTTADLARHFSYGMQAEDYVNRYLGAYAVFSDHRQTLDGDRIAVPERPIVQVTMIEDESQGWRP